MKTKTYIGIDYHKRYSVASAVDERGSRLSEARIDGNTREGFESYISSLPGEKHVVFEACWSWARLNDLLEGMPCVGSITLAHPYKTRAIAEAQVKTDRIDARMLAQLLRGGFVAKSHISSKSSRQAKESLRQRMFWVKARTRLRNRVHALVDRQLEAELPAVSDLFGRKGSAALRELPLSPADRFLLDQDLDALEVLDGHIREIERQGRKAGQSDERLRILRSVPGIGDVLSLVIASEIDDIGRFVRSAKLCSYSGLVPSVHSSGGKTYCGPMMSRSNKWLKWAFVEAAWVAVGCDGYFGSLYRRMKLRGKPSSKAIVAVARRMCQIVWHLLSESRMYQRRESSFSGPL